LLITKCLLYLSRQKAILIQNSWGCYDKKTEILTNKGWKLFKDLDNNEIVATLNPTTQELEYQQIEARQIYDYDGLLWHYQLRDIDLLVTPNHRLYIKPYQKNKGWELVKADEINIKNFSFKKDAKWEGKEVNFWTLGNYQIKMD